MGPAQSINKFNKENKDAAIKISFLNLKKNKNLLGLFIFIIKKVSKVIYIYS